jgi:Rps23 Pro-64 3,4-dihydroxylase Tpa1-like proline 4-hydroxylase
VRGQDQPWMSDDGPEEAMIADIAVAISPSPNRLVLIGEDRPHRVTRVDQNAGAHVRASIAGFFLRAP